MKHFLWAGILLAAGLAACGGNSTPSTNPTPGPTCVPPSGTAYQLIYPAPGATNVPDSFGQIIIASSPAPLPSGAPSQAWDVVIADANLPGGLAGGIFTAAPSPLPSPAATPSFSGAFYQSSSFSGLTPQITQTVQVYLNDTTSSCQPLGPIGSFTTQ